MISVISRVYQSETEGILLVFRNYTELLIVAVYLQLLLS